MNVAFRPQTAATDFDDLLSLPADRLDADDAARLLSVHGCCVVRGALPPKRTTDLRDALAAMYRDLETRHAAGTLSEDELQRNWRYQIVRPLETQDCTASGERVGAAMVAAVLGGCLNPLLRAFLPGDLSILVPTTHARRQLPDGGTEPVPFHQDSAVMRLHGATIVNFWFPMDPCGIDAPSIELVPWNLAGIVGYGGDNRGRLYDHLSIPEATVGAIFNKDGLWRPTFEPGDVLVLVSRTIHRTHVTPAMTRPRMDFEVRLCRTADIPADRRADTIPLTS